MWYKKKTSWSLLLLKVLLCWGKESVQYTALQMLGYLCKVTVPRTKPLVAFMMSEGSRD